MVKMSHKISNEIRMFVEQKYCDIEFLCDDQSENSRKTSIGAHKIILSTASDVFETMFYGEFTKNSVKDSEAKNCVKIIDIDFKIFAKLLGFIYGGNIKFKNVEEGCDFYYAAHKYNVKDAIEFVSQFLLRKLNDENCIFVYETALLYEDHKLKEKFLTVAKKKTKKIIKSNSFLNAMPETVQAIFECDELNIKSELQLVKALKRYIDERSKTDKEIAVKVRPALKCIRFLTFSSKTLSNYIYNTGLLTSDEIVKLISCLSPGKDLSNMPEGFSQSTTGRRSSFFEPEINYIWPRHNYIF